MRNGSCVWLSPKDRARLEGWVAGRNTPQKLVWRARIVLMWADGAGVTAITRATGKTKRTAYRWRERYLERGIAGLERDASRPGRKLPLDAATIARAVHMTLHDKPPAGTHWSVRKLAKAVAISPSSVQRIWAAHGLKPHLTKTFKLSNDKRFVEKVQDIVGLYLDPPDKALVLCVDEKSQIQALERSQPLLPLGLGYVEGVTHDYKRHGTTTLFAALNIATGAVMTQCKPRHRHQEFLQFLRHIEDNVPQDLDVHLIVDNYGTHKHAKVKTWLARRPRFHVHYTPTYASWLNQVETWFNIITRQAIRRDSFRKVKDLVARIERYTAKWNANAHPFTWTATADSILEKVKRLCERISATGH